MNNLKCFICNYNLLKIKTIYLFNFTFKDKLEYIYLCNNHNHLCQHKLYQQKYNNIQAVKKKILDN